MTPKFLHSRKGTGPRRTDVIEAEKFFSTPLILGCISVLPSRGAFLTSPSSSPVSIHLDFVKVKEGKGNIGFTTNVTNSI